MLSNKKHILLLFSGLFLIVSIVSIAQSSDSKNEILPLDFYNIKNGLTHNDVTDILKDSKGYLWIATYDGVNIFDGYKFLHIRSTLHNKPLISNRVRSLCEDKNGNILIGTDNGLMVYDYSKQRSQTFYSNSFLRNDREGPIITKIFIVENTEEIFCLTEKEGILIFDNEYRFQRSVGSMRDLKSESIFYDILSLGGDHFLCATSSGLYHYHYKNNTLSKVLTGIKSASDLQFGIHDDLIYVATREGLMRIIYDPKEFRFFKQDQCFFPDEMINRISIDEYNNYWLGTINNGVIRTLFLDTISNSNDAIKNKYRMSDNPLWISSVFSDKSGHAWIGTLHLGFIKFSTKNVPFQHVDSEYPGDYGMRTNNVLWIASYDSLHMFVKANLGEISYFSLENNKFEYFKPLDDNFIGAQTTVMYTASNGIVWAGTRNRGVYYLEKNKDEFQKLNVDKIESFDNNLFRAIDEDNQHRLWFACKDNVFCMYSDSLNELKVFSINSHNAFIHQQISNVRAIYFDDQKNSIWIGTQSNGLYELNIGADSNLHNVPVRHYYAKPGIKNALQSNFITTIRRTTQGELWLGTESGGISKMVEAIDTVSFISYGESKGLISNVIKAIEEDNEGNLWISTNNGLTQFNPESEEFFLFNSEDGYRINFFETASARMGEGMLVFGGVYGFCLVNPAKIILKEGIPPFRMGRFELFNNEVRCCDTINKKVLLNKPLDDTRHLTLEHNQNVFSVDLVSLHYSDPSVYKIRYRLYPIQKDWITISSSDKTVNFSGLSPGKYVLEAQNANKFGDWSSDELSLSITIRPPLYRSITAFIIYVLLLFFIIFIIVRTARRFLRLEYNLELEQLEKGKAAEINSGKLQFFTNIAHELKTPLTLISGPVEVLREKLRGTNSSFAYQIDMISRQSSNMKFLLDQVIDFQKAENLSINPNFKELDLNALLSKIAEEFYYWASSEGKNLTCSLPKDPLIISTDEKLLERIIYNLIINAFKYTDHGGSIHLKLKVFGENIIFSVKDTGIGIKEEELEKIFERFYRVNNAEKSLHTGSGIGLTFARRLVELLGGTIHVNSTYGVGSEFIVELPQLKKLMDNKDALSEEILMDFGLPTSYTLEETSLDLDIGRDKVFKEVLIYLAEDHNDIRNYLENIFSHHFRVKSFQNGKECLESLESELPELIVSDVMMPEMNGNELCKSIKETNATSHIPVILLTALSSNENRLEGLEVRADEYISKPFHLKFLLLKCYNLLERKEKERDNFQKHFMLGNKNKPDNSQHAEFIEKLFDIMERNLDNSEFQIDDFSQDFAMNRTQFFKKTKSVTSMTPYELLKNFRLNKAAEMLASNQTTVSEVFFQTGFKSRTHFTKIFKELYGMSPGRFIKQNKKS